MNTGNANIIRHIYKEINEGKYKSVKHYELIESEHTTILPTLLNISKNQNCAQSMPDFWLKIRQGNKWSNCITGLFKTGKSSIYKGDVNKRKHLLLFKFSDSSQTLTIYYFENYFTNDLRKVLPLIN